MKAMLLTAVVGPSRSLKLHLMLTVWLIGEYVSRALPVPLEIGEEVEFFREGTRK
jgi:hypothetical protein